MTNYFSNLKKELSFFNITSLFLTVFLPIFSFGIFGPTEIFFANYKAFGVIFDEFGIKFLTSGLLLALILTIILFFVPLLPKKIIMSCTWIFSVGGYIQTMFLNKNLDQIGATTDGYIPTTETLIKDGLIWFAVIAIGATLIIISKQNWRKLICLVSFVLIATQGVAYGTLFLSADEEAFTYTESELVLSGEGQYTVSSKENVIVFILDTISNALYEYTVEDYPDMPNVLSDFTYYNNTDCNYYGTYPSITHILTGHDFDTTKLTNDWLYDAWNNDATVKFYDSIHEAGYLANVYSVEPILFTGSHPLSLIENNINNLTILSQQREIDYPLLYETLLTMSCYRFLPDYFKPYFDVPNTQYASIVSYPDNTINYTNPDFYADLQKKGLSIDTENKRLIFYHLNGIHELINDENCQPIDYNSGTFSGTIKGIWVMLEEYLNQLRSNGAYDNATIIITSDHGSEYHAQSIFFIKKANEHHDTMQITNAPISLDELLPTISHLTLGEYDYLGHSIYDFSEDEKRERTLYIRGTDTNYPAVNRFDGTPIGSNVYHLYTYTGNYSDYLYLYENSIFETVPATDAYY